MGDRPTLFLSYAREDREAVEALYERLEGSGMDPWMDTRDLLPGQRWEPTILEAVRRADFFLALISRRSVTKRGFLQKEIRTALDAWQERLEGDIYLIPVRLEPCETPDLLAELQWLDLYEEGAWERLLKALSVGWARLHATGTGPGIEGPTLAVPQILSRTGQPTHSTRPPVPVHRVGSVSVIAAEGYFNNQGTERIQRVVLGLLEMGHERILIDMSRVRIVNSIGISILIETVEESLEMGTCLAFCSLEPTIEKTFDLMGLAPHVVIFRQREEALTAIEDGRLEATVAELRELSGLTEPAPPTEPPDRPAPPPRRAGSPETRLSRRVVDGVAIIEARGLITIGSGDRALRHAVEAERAAGWSRIVLDLGEVIAVDSSGIGELVACAADLSRHRGRLALTGLAPQVRDILELTQLLSTFEVFGDAEEAVAALRGGSPPEPDAS